MPKQCCIIPIRISDFYRNTIICLNILSRYRIQNHRLTYYHLEANNLIYADENVFAGVLNVEILKLAYNALKMHNDSLKPLKWLREL